MGRRVQQDNLDLQGHLDQEEKLDHKALKESQDFKV